jgi:hypothetical protein
MVAVALSEGSGEFGVLLRPVGVQPLLELVEDHQDFLVGTQSLSLAQGDE